MKMLVILLLSMLQASANEDVNSSDVFNVVSCERGFSIYKDVNCLNPKQDFLFNIDGTLSCKDPAETIITEWVTTPFMEQPIRYIDCNITKGATPCREGFKQVDSTCLKLETDIIFAGSKFVCSTRSMRYTPFDISNGDEYPHLICMKNPRLVESLLAPDNVDRFKINIPVTGSSIVSVNKKLSITNIQLIARGEVIVVSSSSFGLIALSDIIDLPKGDINEYILVTKLLKTTTKRVLKEHIVNSNIDNSILYNPVGLSNIIINSVDPESEYYDLNQYGIKTFDLATLNMGMAIVAAIKSNTDYSKDKIIQYILEEYYHMYELIYRDSKKLE